MLIQRINETQVNEVLLHFKNIKGDFLFNDLNNDSFVLGVSVDKNSEVLGAILAEYKS
ncbi:hypothetical protein [Lysinibacillus capsici]|uniref:hypothetical protein n=1 Tax=Lysinibacillus capsici TaxID=2115968 RepID=UPI002DBCCA27|nr:hypothetical protein [Lysinibacillus capsici]MEC1303809.1 hypothetical protein [Lysinibacillus capsici]